MSEIFEMVAKTLKGLEGVLADELQALGAQEVTQGVRMVSFKGDKKMLYRANFCCRTALRILKPFYKFKSTDADDLYEHVKKFDWTQLMSVNSTFLIDATVYSDDFRHSRFVTYRVKDAIADFFMEREQKRPSIRLTDPDLRINVHIAGNEVTMSLDSSGEPLYKRGWRVAQTDAPINEVLAAGIIKLSGWDGNSNFVDPMCGSGTFLIEAALIAANINPGVYRQGFAFEKWPDFDADLFDEIYNDDTNEREFNYKIYGSDISPKAIAIAEANIKAAGVAKYIQLEKRAIQDITEAPEAGVLVTNPPYGERLQVEDIEALYNNIGEKLKKVYRGYHAWIIGYDPDSFNAIGLKSSVRYPLLNGDLDCELREYVIFDGSFSDMRARGESIRNTDFRASKDRRELQRSEFVETKLEGDAENAEVAENTEATAESTESTTEITEATAEQPKAERKPRTYGDKPRRSDRDQKRGGKFGDHDHKRGDRRFGDKPRFEHGDRKFGERKPRFEGDRKPRFDRERGDVTFGFGEGRNKPRFKTDDRGERRFGDRDRKFGDRKPRFEGDRKPRFDGERGDRQPKFGQKPRFEGKTFVGRNDDGRLDVNAVVRHREPQLGRESERNIVHGRRNAWKRRDNNDENSSNNNE